MHYFSRRNQKNFLGPNPPTSGRNKTESAGPPDSVPVPERMTNLGFARCDPVIMLYIVIKNRRPTRELILSSPEKVASLRCIFIFDKVP